MSCLRTASRRDSSEHVFTRDCDAGAPGLYRTGKQHQCSRLGRRSWDFTWTPSLGHSLEGAPIRIKIGGQTEVIAVNGGFLEVRKDKVVILAESAERSEEIDVERARAARERAELRLQSKQEQIDHHRAEVALQRALNRLNATSIRTNKN